MDPAVSRLEAALAATEIGTPRIPVISNVDAQPHADPENIKKILAHQVSLLHTHFFLLLLGGVFREKKRHKTTELKLKISRKKLEL